jgi:hypothetical protein
MRCGCFGLLLENRIQHVARLGDMGKIDLRLERFIAVATAGPRCFRTGMAFIAGAEMRSHFFGFEILQRTGMRFFLGDPQLR